MLFSPEMFGKIAASGQDMTIITGKAVHFHPFTINIIKLMDFTLQLSVTAN